MFAARLITKSPKRKSLEQNDSKTWGEQTSKWAQLDSLVARSKDTTRGRDGMFPGLIFDTTQMKKNHDYCKFKQLNKFL